MIKKNIKKICFIALSLIALVGCEPYEDFIKDYDYSAVYFGSQQPLRTLVAREGEDKLEFKLGVVLAGLRENKQNHWATFEIDPALLPQIDTAHKLKMLPADWYTLSVTDNKIVIPKGAFLGDFTISIDKAKFTADPLSLSTTYAIPVRILETSADSILRGNAIVARKDYTVLVVKYISENSGTYYVKGEQIELDASGNEIADTKKSYFHVDWSQNTTRDLTNITLADCEMKGLGTEISEKMLVTFGVDKAVTLSTVSLAVTDLGCTYSEGIHNFKYTYKKGAKTFKVNEFLKQRNDPENELRFEEWK